MEKKKNLCRAKVKTGGVVFYVNRRLDCNPNNAFFAVWSWPRNETKRVVPPVLEFFRSFFAEEEYQSELDEEEVEEAREGGRYDRQRDDIKNHNAAY